MGVEYSIDLSKLTSDSTLGNLPSHQFQVSLETPGQMVAQTFARKPEIPGVIITHETRLVGMISRRKFYEWMSQPYSSDLYLNRPIKILLNFIKVNPLQLAECCKIEAAAKIALNRPEDLVYEPIAIVFQDKTMRLLDMHVLLLGQSHILNLLKDVIKLQKIERESYVTKLQEEQEKVKSYTNLLEFNLVQMQRQNQKLEEQKYNYLKQAREIAQLNEKFIQIGKIISVEGRNAFQATFAGVNEICRNTDRMAKIGKALAKELETVNVASRLIAQVSQQMRYLGIQAAVAANRVSEPFNEFSNAIAEIGKVISQTFEAGRQIDRLGNRFKIQVHELSDSAREGATVARSLIQQIERANEAIAELEELVKDGERRGTVDFPQELPDLNGADAKFLLEKIERAEGVLEELEEAVKHQDVKRLIQELELVLCRAKQKIV